MQILTRSNVHRAVLVAMSVVVAVLAAKAHTNTAASEWPQWRGPNRDGISPETGLNMDWTAGAPPLAWEAEGMGAGYSAVSVAGGRVFTMGDHDNDQYVIALSEKDGSQLWRTKIGGGGGGGGYPGPRCTPTVDGQSLYVVGIHGAVAALNIQDGAILWQKDLQKDFNGRMMSGWGYSESPLVDGDRLVCTPGGREAGIVALDKKTGRTLWQAAVPYTGDRGREGAAYSSIVISHGGGVRQYVQLMGRGVVGVRASDGRFLWGYDKVANGTANIPTPIVSGDYVFASSGYGTGSALLRLKRNRDNVEVEEVYFLEARTLQNHHGGLILLGEHIYGGHGNGQGLPVCVEMKSGNVVWSPGRGPGSGSAAVACVDGHLVFRYQNGLVASIEATPEEYRVKGTFQIPNVRNPSWPHPVIANGKLYLREQDKLYCHDLRPSAE